jgi:thiol-disulfide isomerase/thioredoxin
MNNWIRFGALGIGLLMAAGIALALTVGRGGLNLNNSIARGGGDNIAVGGSGPAAPEFTGIVGWDNSPPLTIAGLRGKVVLVDFWTYSCINCQRTLPYLRQWWDRYKADGLVIVGVHSPEFQFEHDPGNVKRALGEYNVTWPVALDSNMSTWNAYNNQFWPAEYLIDKKGHVRHTHFGEGEYDVTESAIQQLLSEGGAKVNMPLASVDPNLAPGSGRMTGETYAGSERGDGSIRTAGAWSLQPQFAEHTADAPLGHDYAELTYTARRAFLVAGSSGASVTVWVTIDGRAPTAAEVGDAVHFDSSGHAYVTVDHHDIFGLIAMPSSAQHVLRISPDKAGFQLYTFTFG